MSGLNDSNNTNDSDNAIVEIRDSSNENSLAIDEDGNVSVAISNANIVYFSSLLEEIKLELTKMNKNISLIMGA